MSPDFSLARGWLRQLDIDRNHLFYDGRELTHARYRQWLHEQGIRWVAASDARLDYSAADEDALVRERSALPAPAGPARALAHVRGGGRARARSGAAARTRAVRRLTALEPESFTLDVTGLADSR